MKSQTGSGHVIGTQYVFAINNANYEEEKGDVEKHEKQSFGL